MKILGKRILIQPTEVDKTAGGIFLPDVDNPMRQNQEGLVLAIGSGIQEALPYHKGSHVFVGMYKADYANILIVNNKECFLIDQESICGVEINGTFHPVGDKILLKPLVTVSSNIKIIRPSAYEADTDNLIHCTVHLLGNGVRNKKGEYQPFTVRIGDKVLIKPLCGRDVEAAECTYKLVKETDIEANYE